jgi:uncharacterized protein YceK
MSRDCPRHTGVVAEVARAKCQVCTYELATYLASRFEARMEEAQQFERVVLSKYQESVRQVGWWRFKAIAFAFAFVAVTAMAALSGCSHVQRRTIETASTSTATVQAETKSSATATQVQDVQETRKVRAGKRITPRADGGWDVDFYLDDWRQLAGEAKQESAAAVKVEAKATEHTEAKLKDVHKEPPSLWRSVELWLVVIVVLGGAGGVAMAWRKLKGARG